MLRYWLFFWYLQAHFLPCWSPLSDIFFWDPHDITRYFAIWYDYHTILTIFYNSWTVPNLSKNSAKRVICMSNTHNGLRWMHQMHKSGKKVCQFMLNVCLYKCKESSDLNFRGKLKAIYSAYLIINIVWYFQKKCDIDILTIFWKWHDNCITIYRQTIFWGLVKSFCFTTFSN